MMPHEYWNQRRRSGILEQSQRYQSIRIDVVFVVGMHQTFIKGPSRDINASSIQHAPALNGELPFLMYVRDLVAHARQARQTIHFSAKKTFSGKTLSPL